MSSKPENASSNASNNNNNNNINNNEEKTCGDDVILVKSTDDVSDGAGSANVNLTVKTGNSGGADDGPAAAKTSGLKTPAPSRIGRPCAGTQKPAVPTTPTKNEVRTNRKLTDIFGRYKLKDVQEDDNENEEDRGSHLKRNRYHSTGSAASLDTLWDLYPRRLSEAGVSRHSDAVLTEDTDGFIIGQRVWVNGTKPGSIAFIGETQFAPGEWAGIVLDHPIGKNDGSVGGMRYFQCEPKKGIFARLTRLTRVPLDLDEDGSCSTPSPVNNGSRRSPISPSGSTRSLLKSPVSISNSNTSLSSSLHIDYKIGDRVIIKSSQGSKVGTLKFLGFTDFANGEWCGVELDEPRGKNDGSVDGIRYFECRPNFGLFAPISKVSKSPSKRKPSQCVVHSGTTGLPPSGLMRREGSRESMASMTSYASGASSARRVRLGVTSLTHQKIGGSKATTTPLPTRTLQDVLREKQQHIEQLLKERDLERAEITRAASQADDAEQKLATLRQEYEHYRSQCEQKLKEHVSVLSHLKIDQAEVLSQLEDEKRKIEDLQFRFEEETISKGDIEVTNEANLKRIKELEELVEAEKRKVAELEANSNRLLDTEESLVKSRNEIEALQKELHSTRKKRETGDSEHAELLASLQQQLSETKSSEEESLRKIRSLEEQILTIASDKDAFKMEVDGFKEKFKERDDECMSKDKEIEDIKAELIRTKQLLQEKTVALDEALVQNRDLQEGAVKELDRVKRDFSAKVNDLEVAQETIAQKDKQIDALNTELQTIKVNFEVKTNDLERYRNSSDEIVSTLKKELEETRETLKHNIDEIETIRKDCALQLSEKEMRLDEANKTIKHNSIEMDRLNTEVVDLRANLEETANEVHARHTRNIENRDAQLRALSLEIQTKNEEIAKCSIVTSKLEDDLCAKNSVIEKLKIELETFRSQHHEAMAASAEYGKHVNALQLQIGDCQRQQAQYEQRIVELMREKELIASEAHHTMVATSGDCASKLEILNTEFVSRERQFHMEHRQIEEKLFIVQRNEQDLQLKLQQALEEMQRTKHEYEALLSKSQSVELMLRGECERKTAEISQVRDELQMKLVALQHVLEEKNMLLKTEMDRAAENDRFLKDQLNRNTAELQNAIEQCQRNINVLTSEALEAKRIIAQKTEEVIGVNAQYQQLLAQTSQKEAELKASHEETVRRIEFDLTTKVNELRQYSAEIELLKRDCSQHNVNVAARDHQISTLLAQLQGLQQLIAQLENERNQLRAEQGANVNAVQEHQQLLIELTRLTEKAKECDALAGRIEWERANFFQTMQQLQLSVKQKNLLIEQFEKNANENGEMNRCSNLIELAKNIQAVTIDEHTQKVMELQRLVDSLRGVLTERDARLELQRIEILQLQSQLLQARQMCEQQASAIPQAGNSVSLLHGCRPYYTTPYSQNTQHALPLPNPLELQVKLISLRNSYNTIYYKFVNVQRVTMIYTLHLQQALNAGDYHKVAYLTQVLRQLRQQFAQTQKLIDTNRYMFVKTLQDAILHLQTKHNIIYSLYNQIRELQLILNRLPTQCKLGTAQHVIVPPLYSPCANIKIELEKMHNKYNAKDTYINVLQKQIVSLYEMLKVSKPSIYYCKPGTVDINTCPQTRTVIKRILVPMQRPPRILIQKVPIYVPRVVIKQVAVPLIGGHLCPAPKVIFMRVPSPPIVINRPVAVAVPPKLVPVCDKSQSYQINRVLIQHQQHQINSLKILLYRCNAHHPTVPYCKLRPEEGSSIKSPSICPAAKTIIKEVPRPCGLLPKLLMPAGCLLPSQIVNNLLVKGFHPASVYNFKRDLYNLLLQQKLCGVTKVGAPCNLVRPPMPAQCPYRTIIRPVYITRPGTTNTHVKPVPVPMVLPPRVIIKHVRVPMPVPHIIAVPQPPRILIKQVPVVVSQPPRVITKQVPIFVGSQQRPQIIIKERPVYVTLPPRIIVQQRPVNIRVPVPVPFPVPQPARIIIRRVPMPYPLPPRYIVKHIRVAVPTPVPVPQPARIIIRRVPMPYPLPPRYIVKHIQVPVPTPVPIPQPARIIIKKVLMPYPLPPRYIVKHVGVPVPTPVPIPQPARIIIRRVPMPYPLPPRYIVKHIQVPVPTPVPVPQPARIIIRRVPMPYPLPPRYIVKHIGVPVPTPVPVPQPARIIIRKVLMPYPLPPRYIVKHVGVPVPTPVPIPQPARIIIRRVPMPYPLPPRYIVKHIQVPVPTPVPVPQPARIIIRRIPMPYPLPPRYIVKQVAVPQPVYIKVPRPVYIRVPERVPYPVPKPYPYPIRVKIPVPVPVKIPYPITVHVPRPVYIRIPVRVPILQPARVIIRRVPFFINQRPRLVYIRVPQIIIKRVPLPPRYIKVAVPVPQPPRIIYKQIAMPVPMPPRIIVKQIAVPVKQYVTIRIPIPIHHPGKIIYRPIAVPVPQPAKIIYKQIAVPVPLPPRIIIKQVPVPFNVPVPLHIKVPSPVYIRLPVPVPVKVPHPVYVRMPVNVLVRVPVPRPVPVKVAVLVRIPVPYPIKLKVPTPVTVPHPVYVRVPVPVKVPFAVHVNVPEPYKVVQRVYIRVPSIIPYPLPPKRIIIRVPQFIIRHVPSPPQYIRVPIPQAPRIIYQQVAPSSVLVSYRSRISYLEHEMTSLWVRLKKCGQVAPVLPPPPPSENHVYCPPIQPPRVMVQTVPVVKRVYIPSPPEYIRVPMPLPSRNVYIRVPEIRYRTVYKHIYQPPRYVRVPVYLRGHTQIIPSPPRIIYQQLPPRTIIRQVAVPVKMPIIIRVPDHNQGGIVARPILVPVPQPPQIIYRQIAVPVVQPPRILIKHVTTPVYLKSPVYIRVPEIRYRTVYKHIYQPPRYVRVPVYLRGHTQIIPSPPRIIYQQLPPRTIIRQVAVPVRMPVIIRVPDHNQGGVVARPILVPMPQPPQIIYKQIAVPVVQPPRVLIKHVTSPVYIRVPEIRYRTVYKHIYQPPRYVRVPVYLRGHTQIIPSPPRIIYQQLPPRTIIRQVAVPVKMPVIIRVPDHNQGGIVARPILVPVPQPPQIIYRQIAVPVVQPPKVLIKYVTKPVYLKAPVYIRVPEIRYRTVYKHIYQPRYVRVPVYLRGQTQIIPSPPRIIYQQLPPRTITRQVAVFVPQRPVYIRVPQFIIRHVPSPPQYIRVPIPQPPRIIYQQVAPSSVLVSYRSRISYLEHEMTSLWVRLKKCGQVAPVLPPPPPSENHVYCPPIQPPRVMVQTVPVVKRVYIPSPPQYIRVPMPLPSRTVYIRVPEIRYRTVYKHIYQPRYVRVPVYLRGHTQIIPSPPRIIYQQLPPRTIIRQVAVPVKMPVIIRVPDHNQGGVVARPILVPVPQPPQIIYRQIAVPVVQPPRVLIKYVTKPVYLKSPVYIRVPEIRYRTVYRNIYQPPRYIKMPFIVTKQVAVHVPVPQPPKIIVEQKPMRIIVRVPLPVPVPVPQPPRIIYKQIGVPVPQPAQIIYRQIPVPVRVPVVMRVPFPIHHPSKYIIRPVPFPVPQPPRIIYKQIAVPVPQPPRTIIKQMPVPIHVPVIHRVLVPMPQAPRIIVKQVPIFLPQPPRIIIKHVPLYKQVVMRVPLIVPGPPQIIYRNRYLTIRVPVHISVPQPPKIFIKQMAVPVRIPVPMPVQVPVRVPVHIPMPMKPRIIYINSPPRIIIKQVSVPVPLPPRVIIKHVPVPMLSQTRPQYIIKQIAVPVPSPPRIIVKQVAVGVPHHVPVPVVQPPRVIIQRMLIRVAVPMPFERPPRVIVKQTPVLVRIPISVPILQPPKVIVKEVAVPIPQPPRVIYRNIVMRVPTPVPVPYKMPFSVPVPVYQPPRYVYRQVAVYIQRPPIVTKVPVPVRVPVTIRVGVPVPQPPKIFLQKVLVRVPGPVRVVYKQTAVPVRYPVIIRVPAVSQPSGYITRYVPVPVPQPPRILIKNVMVPVPQPPRIIYKHIAVPITHTVAVHVPIPLPQAPKIFIKHVIVRVPQPPRIITKQVPLPVRVPISVPVYRTVGVPVPIPQPPRIIYRQVAMPVPGPIRTIYKQTPVPVPIPVPVPRIVIKRVVIRERPQVIYRTVATPPVYVRIPQPPRVIVKIVRVMVPPRVVYKHVLVRVPMPVPPVHVPVPIPQPSRVIYRQVPVYIRQPGRVIIKQVPVPIRVPVNIPYPVGHTSLKVIRVPVLQPAKIIIHQIPIPMAQPYRIIYKQVPVPLKMTVAVRVPVYLPQAPRIIFKHIPVPMGISSSVLMSCRSRVSYLEHEMSTLWFKLSRCGHIAPVLPPLTSANHVYCPPPQPPRVIIQRVPVVQAPSSMLVSYRSRISYLEHEISSLWLRLKSCGRVAPVLPPLLPSENHVYCPPPQPPRVIIQRVPLVQAPSSVLVSYRSRISYLEHEISSLWLRLKSCGRVAPVLPPPPPSENHVYCPPIQPARVIVQRVPVVQPPRILVQQIPTPVVMPPRLIIKQVAVPFTRIVKVQSPVYIRQPPRIIIRQVAVPVPQPPKIIIKQVPIPVRVPIIVHTQPGVVMKPVPVPMIQPPKVIIRQVPVPVYLHPKTIVRQVPVYLRITVPVNRLIMVPQPAKIIIKQVAVPVPQAPLIKQVSVPVYIHQRIPIPMPSPTRFIIKTVPVYQPPKLVHYPPRIVIQHVPIPVPQPPRVVIQQVPVPYTVIKRIPQIQIGSCSRPRVVVQTVPVYRVVVRQMPVPIPQPARVITKLMPVPVPQPPQIIVKHLYLPPRILIKQVPMYIRQPPQIIIRRIVVPSVHGTICTAPSVVVQRIPIVLPPKVLIRQVMVPVPQPPRYIPIPPTLPSLVIPTGVLSPSQIINYLTFTGYQSTNVAIFKRQLYNLLISVTKQCRPQHLGCPAQKIIYVPQPPRILINPAPNCPPQTGNSLLVPNIPAPPCRPSPMCNRLHITVYQQNVLMNRQKLEIIKLQQDIHNLLSKLQACSLYLQSKTQPLNSWGRPQIIPGTNPLMPQLQVANQCYAQIQVQKAYILSLKKRLSMLLCRSTPKCHLGCRQHFKIHQHRPAPAVPLPMMHAIQTLNPSAKFNPLQLGYTSSRSVTRAFAENLLKAYTHTQQALTHCMNAVLMQTISLNQSQMCGDGNHQQLIEEKEFAENQIEFLNSIIVDMQKKNQEQQSRIEILEQGYGPSAVQELNLLGLHERKTVPPRVYCDICEEFDLHETDDCPRQSNEDYPAVVMRQKRDDPESNKPPPRSYCDNCEVFGHSTEDCPEDQTF